MPDLSLFSTPVSMFDLTGMEDINRRVTEQLVGEANTQPSVHRSNVGGWHSQNLAMRPEPHFRELVHCIVTRVRETVASLAEQNGRALPGTMRIGAHAWAMVMRNGDYTIPHDHSEVHWATVYYADAGDADEKAHPASGLLALVDPRHGGRPMPGLDLVGGTYTVLPKTGRLVVFPGWLMHYVHSYFGKRPRVSISCNVIFEPVQAGEAATSSPAAARRTVSAIETHANTR